ncbi:hypothetical protein NIES4071_22840 [Calothrix sp. NIES-4071]|nr:hypothetical protein NIES4071_22840 [Calothrix sp. NIES-4071]BAZ56615.1 hypothetical protein NIES4105_22790 [Calothrix sp. NIES-4105]
MARKIIELDTGNGETILVAVEVPHILHLLNKGKVGSAHPTQK